MRKSKFLFDCILVLIIVVFVLMVGRAALTYVFDCQDRAAEAKIHLLIPHVESYFVEYGQYPKKLNEIKGYLGVDQKKVLVVLSTPLISYHSREGGCLIYYNKQPLGPHRGYDSLKKEWVCFE